MSNWGVDLLEEVYEIVEKCMVKHNLTKEQAWTPLALVAPLQAYGPRKLTEAEVKVCKKVLARLKRERIGEQE